MFSQHKWKTNLFKLWSVRANKMMNSLSKARKFVHNGDATLTELLTLDSP